MGNMRVAHSRNGEHRIGALIDWDFPSGFKESLVLDRASALLFLPESSCLMVRFLIPWECHWSPDILV